MGDSVLFEKTSEYWLILVGMFGWLMMKKVNGVPLWKHSINSVISAVLAIGLTPMLAEKVWGGENGALILIMVGGTQLLNTLAALTEDKKWMRGLVEKMIGKSGGDPDVK